MKSADRFAIVNLGGQEYVNLKDGLFLKYPELVNTLCLLPEDTLPKFFAIWNNIKKDESMGGEKLMATHNATVQVNDSYYYVNFIVIKRSEESIIYFRDFRQITIDDVLDRLTEMNY